MLLEKAKLDTIKIMISRSLIGSYISHGEFVSVAMLRENNEMKEEEKKSPERSVEHLI